MKFTPDAIAALKASHPQIRRLHPAALLLCLRAIEKQADATACACQDANCAAYDLDTHTVTRHGQPVLKAEWFPADTHGPLKITKV